MNNARAGSKWFRSEVKNIKYCDLPPPTKCYILVLFEMWRKFRFGSFEGVDGGYPMSKTELTQKAEKYLPGAPGFSEKIARKNLYRLEAIGLIRSHHRSTNISGMPIVWTFNPDAFRALLEA